jgi:integral membrane sensor domain MASE1
MMAMRGGIAIGSLLTGISVSFLGINHALFINGAIAVAVQIIVGWGWYKKARPL